MPVSKPLTTKLVTALLSPLISSPAPDDCKPPLMTTSGPFGLVWPVKEVCVKPSMVVSPSIIGSGDEGLIVKTPLAKPGSVVGC